MNKLNYATDLKAYKISKFWIDRIGLNLTGLNILTEVGSNYYKYLPLIASIAGAKNVTAWCKDSKYGLAEEIVQEAKNAIKIWSCNDNIIFRSNDRNFQDIQNSDIITNSGMLRPLDSQFIRFAKQNAVISLMFESWELRPGDIDLDICRENKIRVTGVSENNSVMSIFEYSGILAAKLILNAGVEIFQSNILIWSNDEFGEIAKKWIQKLEPKTIIICNDTDKFYQFLENADLVYFCDYHEDRQYFGPKGFLSLDRISQIKPTITFCHLYGKISKFECNKFGIKLYPDKDGQNKIMSETLSFVGIEPVIQLLIAGLKAAQEVFEGESYICSQKII